MSHEDYFIEDSVVSEVTSKAFSSKVGDEASSITLSLTLKVTGLVVKSEDIFALVGGILQDKIPEGFVLREDQLAIGFEYEEEEEKVYELAARIVANLLPEVKPDELADNIAGKYPTLAQDFLTSIPGFSRAEIRLKPKLPGSLGSLPHLTRNIEIEVAAER